MESRTKRAQSWRFGIFEVDNVGVKLLRSGVQVRIQEQPFRILVILLEHAGEVVTRNELCRMLWPADTFVDFDHSLNTAVMKLREALGDSADRSLYIETIPKRGYRFIGPLSQVMDTENGLTNNGSSSASTSTSMNGVISTTGPPIEGGLIGRSKYWKRPTLYAAAAALGVVMTACLVFWKIDRPPRALRVTRFTKLTNDGQTKAGPLASDGSRIYFTEVLPDARTVIIQVSANGGDTTAIPIQLRQPGLLDLSRDGMDLLLSSNDETNKLSFWLQPVAGGSPRRIGTLLGKGAAFGADANGILYSDDHGIYTVGHDGVVFRKLLALEHSAFNFRSSPDAKVIRFSQSDTSSDTTFITQAKADGTEPRKIADGCCGEWTADGRFFIYQHRVDNRLNLWALPELGVPSWEIHAGKAVQLTAGPLDFTYPLPSKDGKRIFAIASAHQAEIIRYDSHSQAFVPYLSGISADGLAFSPDGHWVAYTSYPDATLWRSRVDGSERLQLTFSHMRTAFPRWSPDGKQIAFSGNMPGEPWNIYIISSAGGTAEHLFPSRESQMDVNWSPDGNSLLYCDCGEGHS